MRINKKSKRIFSLCLSIIFILTVYGKPFSVLAVNIREKNSSPEADIIHLESNINEDGYINSYMVDNEGNIVKKKLISGLASTINLSNLPERYNLNELGYITSVKNQGDTGTCWAHAAVNSAESYLILNKKADTNINLSEAHMVYFGQYAYSEDPNDPLYHDGYNVGADAYKYGGNSFYTQSILARGVGIISQDASENILEQPTFDEKRRYESEWLLTNSNEYSKEDRDVIKSHIMEKGALFAGYFHYNDKYNKTYYSYNQPTQVEPVVNGMSAVNHAISIVGWDDNFSKDQFVEKPAGNGAWICKNSWNTTFGDEGYFYISYYDATLCDIHSIEVVEADRYDKIYQYDGTKESGIRNSAYMVSGANMYTAEKDFDLKAVSFYTMEAGMPYDISVYKNAVMGQPSSGELVYKESGVMPYVGYHVVELETSVFLKQNEVFTIVISLNKNGAIFVGDKYTNSTGRSFFCFNGGAWIDASDKNLDLAIKAFVKTHEGQEEQEDSSGATETSSKEAITTKQEETTVVLETTSKIEETTVVQETTTTEPESSSEEVKTTEAMQPTEPETTTEIETSSEQETTTTIETSSKQETTATIETTTTEPESSSKEETTEPMKPTEPETTVVVETSNQQGTTTIETSSKQETTTTIETTTTESESSSKEETTEPMKPTEPETTTEIETSSKQETITTIETSSKQETTATIETTTTEPESSSKEEITEPMKPTEPETTAVVETSNQQETTTIETSSKQETTAMIETTTTEPESSSKEETTESMKPTEAETTTAVETTGNQEETRTESETTSKVEETTEQAKTTESESTTKQEEITTEPESTTKQEETTTKQEETTTEPETTDKVEETTKPAQNKKEIKDVQLSTSTYSYDGVAKRPKPVVKAGTQKLKAGTDYTVTYKNNINPGTATVIVIGKGNYTGTITRTFKINLSKVANFKQSTNYATTKITMSWSKVKGADGYAIYRASTKNGSYKYLKSVTINTAAHAGLKASSKYYYKVRAYKTVNGKKVYGAYSDAKSMLTKSAAPTGFAVVLKSRTAKISWPKVTGAQGYEVYMANSRNGSYTRIKNAGVSTTSYSKTGLVKGKKYYFKMRAYTKTGTGTKVYSGYSKIKAVTVK